MGPARACSPTPRSSASTAGGRKPGRRRPCAIFERMKVVVLCGGLGTRLRDETEFRPKPMIEVGGHPLLWHIMKIYAHYGFNEFVLALGYKGESIRQYFLNYEAMTRDVTIRLDAPSQITLHSGRQAERCTWTLADTGASALTGARVKRVDRYVDGPRFMLTHGNTLAHPPIPPPPPFP